MPVKKRTAGKPRGPKKFVVVRNSASSECYDAYCRLFATEEAALAYVQKEMNGSHPPAAMAIYQLIKIVRRKVTPIEIEEVACCEVAK